MSKKFTIKEQDQFVTALIKEHGFKPTKENLEALIPKDGSEVISEVLYGNSERGLVLFIYEPETEDFQECSPFLGHLLLTKRVSMEEVQETYSHLVEEDKIINILVEIPKLPRNEILEKYKITPDPEYIPWEGDQEGEANSKEEE